MKRYKKILRRIFWRRRFCTKCLYHKLASDYGPCSRCIRGSEFMNKDIFKGPHKSSVF